MPYFLLSFTGALRYNWAQKVPLLPDLYPASQPVEGSDDL